MKMKIKNKLENNYKFSIRKIITLYLLLPTLDFMSTLFLYHNFFIKLKFFYLQNRKLCKVVPFIHMALLLNVLIFLP